MSTLKQELESMSKKQIDNISLLDAIRVLKVNSIKFDFAASDNAIKKSAREILRNNKKVSHGTNI